MAELMAQARLFAAWIERAQQLHRLARDLTAQGTATFPGDGMAYLAVPSAHWRALVSHAEDPLPEVPQVPAAAQG